MKPKPKSKKSKPEIKVTKSKFPKKTKLERILFEENISMKDLHDGTGIAYPTLFNMAKGRKTTFRNRTIRDLEEFLKRPSEQFLGFEGESANVEIED